MKRLMTSALMVMALGGMARAATDAPEARYQTMLAAAKADPAHVDWQALRFAFADQPDFMALDLSLNDARRKMLDARRVGDLKAMLTQANAILDKDFVDGQAHLEAGVAMNALGQADGPREQALAVAIFRSIQTGDGLTPTTAFTVISISEEYQLMFARQRKVTRQSLQRTGGHAYDVLDTVDRDGANPVSFYFLVDRVLAAEAKEFAPKP